MHASVPKPFKIKPKTESDRITDVRHEIDNIIYKCLWLMDVDAD